MTNASNVWPTAASRLSAGGRNCRLGGALRLVCALACCMRADGEILPPRGIVSFVLSFLLPPPHRRNAIKKNLLYDISDTLGHNLESGIPRPTPTGHRYAAAWSSCTIVALWNTGFSRSVSPDATNN